VVAEVDREDKVKGSAPIEPETKDKEAAVQPSLPPADDKSDVK
jgi:hypothetical protein